jgi:hypothetical protein
MKVPAVVFILCGVWAVAQDPAVQNLPIPSVKPLETAVDQPASRQEILRLLEVMRLRQQALDMQSAIQTQLRAMFDQMLQKQGSPLGPEEKKKMQELMSWSFQRSIELYPVDEMISDFVPIYQKHLNRADVQAILDFYASHAGKRLLDKTPALTREGMELVMTKTRARMDAFVPEMEAKIKEILGSVPRPKRAAPPQGARKPIQPVQKRKPSQPR